MVCFLRHVERLPPALTVSNKVLETVDAHKVLGVTIQSNLKWDLHVNEVLAREGFQETPHPTRT